MLQSLIRQAETKAGSQIKLADILGVQRPRLADYKAGRRVPDDILIGRLADYLGINPIDTILLCKLETEDEEKATLLRTWLNKWHPIGDSNPCYRRERVGVLLAIKVWQRLYHRCQYIFGQMGVFLRGFDVAMSK